MAKERTVSARTASAAVWLVGGRFLTRGIDLILLLLLARLLVPADFGLVAIAMTLISLVEAILELPLGAVLVSLPAIERAHLDTAFTLSLLRGLALAAIVAACAWPFAAIYHDARLAPVICVLGLAPALRGLASPNMVHFAQALDFRRDFVIDLTGKLVGLATAAAIAFATRSYWGIVIGTVSVPAGMLIASYVLAPHRPRLTLATWSVFRGFLAFSTAAQAAAAFSWQCDRLILGRLVPHALLGAYSLANDIAYLPEQALIKPIVRPVSAALMLVRDDPDRLRSAYAKTVAVILGIGLPVMLGLSLLADPAVRLVLGGKWLAAVPMLAWLPLTLIPALYWAPLPSLVVTLGRPRLLLHFNLAEVALRVPLIVTGGILASVPGVIAARMIAGLLVGRVGMRQVHALLGVRARDQLRWVERIAVAGGALGVTLFTLRPLLVAREGVALAFGLVGCGGLGLFVYAVTLFALWHAAGRPAGAEQALFDGASRLFPPRFRRMVRL